MSVSAWAVQISGREGPILAEKRIPAWNLLQTSWITDPEDLKPPIILDHLALDPEDTSPVGEGLVIRQQL